MLRVHSFYGCCSLVFFFSFSLMIQRPPRATLLPYTTLFRSNTLSALTSAANACQSPFSSHSPARFGSGRFVAGRRVDRKSTRLNSSHVSISYAVFCLKKKKNKSLYNNAASSHQVQCPYTHSD